MTRPRVVHLVFPRPDAARPVVEFVWDAARRVNERFDVEIVVPLPILRRLAPRASWPADIADRLLALAPRPRLVRYLPAPGRSVESATLSICAALARERPALVHGSFLDLGGYAAAEVGRALGVPSIAVAHGTDARSAHVHSMRRRVLGAAHGATTLIAVCHEIAGRLARLGRAAEVVPFTAAPEEFPLAPPPRARRILFVGRVERKKGVDLLLEAFARIVDRSARLVLVGPRGDLDVDAEARRLGIHARVEILGEHPRSALPALYADASCLALPSRGEGLACVLVEALLTGRPVVASAVGGSPELVDEAVGRIVPAEDVPALARALDHVLETPFDPARLRARALPVSWAASAPKLVELTARTIECASRS